MSSWSRFTEQMWMQIKAAALLTTHSTGCRGGGGAAHQVRGGGSKSRISLQPDAFGLRLWPPVLRLSSPGSLLPLSASCLLDAEKPPSFVFHVHRS